MERWQILKACAVGGAITTAITLAVAPLYWLLAIVVGLAAGYLTHEFREVLAAIPIAWQRATTSLSG